MDEKKEKLLDAVLSLIHDLRHAISTGDYDKAASVSVALDQVVKAGKDTGII